MSSLAKREWTPRLTVDAAQQVAVGWIMRARQKNVISQSDPAIFTAYVVDESPFTGLMTDISSIFRYSSKDDPDMDRIRDAALKLLSVAMKAHFFLFRDALVRHEPYVFSIPDLSHPGMSHTGLVYRLDSRESNTIMVATCDLAAVSSLRPDAYRFPVVLTRNNFRWFDRKHWIELTKEAEIGERIMKPWIAKQETNIADTWKTIDDFPFGQILDVPYDIREFAKPAGVKWAGGIKKWYLPKGFDVEPVREYIQWLKNMNSTNREALDALFWRGQFARAEFKKKVADEAAK